jgi:dinuclear metal center YbgI/SA1388 family protein
MKVVLKFANLELMKIHRQQLIEYFDQILTPQLFEDYAPNGLQIEGTQHLQKVAFAVSATRESLEAAIKWQAQALIVHHGVFWKYQGARTVTGPWGHRIQLAIKNDLNLLAYHLPLDAHPEVGNAACLGKSLGLSELKPFAVQKKQYLGSQGRFEQPLSARELKLKLEKLLQHQVLLASPDENKLISSLGIITGGANNEWPKALEENLDAYLTGEISEYNWHDAIEAGLHYFAGGHHATERFGVKALMERLNQDFPQIETCFFDSANPA